MIINQINITKLAARGRACSGNVSHAAARISSSAANTWKVRAGCCREWGLNPRRPVQIISLLLYLLSYPTLLKCSGFSDWWKVCNQRIIKYHMHMWYLFSHCDWWTVWFLFSDWWRGCYVYWWPLAFSRLIEFGFYNLFSILSQSKLKGIGFWKDHCTICQFTLSADYIP